MRALRALCVLVVLTLASRGVAVAAGAAAQTDANSLCAIKVTAEAVADRRDELAFQLWAPGTSGGAVSGSLVVYADAQRFDVPFVHAEVAPARVPGQREVDPAPVVVQFPSAVDLESAYVGSLPGQNIPQCLIYAPFIGPNAGGAKLYTISDVAGVTPIKAPLPQPAAPANCKVPYRAPYVGYQASAQGPSVLLVKAQVTVTALLKADGKVLGFTVAGAPDHSSLKDRAVAATVGSKFYPETYRCQAVAGQYVFVVNFQANEASLSAPMGNNPMDVTQGRARDEPDHSKLTPDNRDRSAGGAIDCAKHSDADQCASPNAPGGSH